MPATRPVLIVLLLLAAPVRAQPADTTLLEAMRSAYRALDYAGAEAAAQHVLAAYQQYTVDELTEVHTTLALVAYARNREDEARRHFEAALSLDGELELDPVLVSPKILAFFEEVRTGARAQADEPVVVERYIRVEDPRRAAALRSMMVPGLGQLYKAERAKGWLLIGAWGGTVAAAGVAHLLRQDARRAYLDARDPGVAAARYAVYNRRHKVRNGLVLAAAGVWLYAYLDALIRPASLPEARRSTTTLTIVPGGDAAYARVALAYTF